MTTRPDLDAQIRTLQDRAVAAQRARVRAEHERDSATTSAASAANALRSEFGVSTVEEATTMLADLEAALAAEIDAVTTLLDGLPT